MLIHKEEDSNHMTLTSLTLKITTQTFGPALQLVMIHQLSLVITPA